MMTSKNWDAIALLFKITTVLKLSPMLLTQKVPWPSVFLTSKISPLQSALLTLPSYLLTFYTHTPLSIWASWVPSPSAPKSPPSAWEPHPPLFLLHLRGQLTPFSFQLASPPRIHMDSWWAARNPNQGPKWAHNISQNRSGAYGPEPCRIWASKLLELVFYLSWLNEPAEPAEPDANWSTRWKKIMKIWQNVPRRVRNPWKKWCIIPSLEEGDMIKTITKNQCSTPADLMNRLNRLNRLPTSRPVVKKLENFTECS